MKDETIQAAKALWKCMKEEGIGNIDVFASGHANFYKNRILFKKMDLSAYPDPIKPETAETAETAYPQTLAEFLEWMREYGVENGEDVRCVLFDDGSFDLFDDGSFGLLDSCAEARYSGRNILTDLPPIKPDHLADFIKGENTSLIDETANVALQQFFQYLKENDLLK